jgi:hypothetical protein
MKKIIVLLGFTLAFAFALSTINVAKTYAQDTDVCGGIQGLVCSDGYFCEYEDGDKAAPYPDAAGKCKSNEYNCKGKANGTVCKRCQPCPQGQICAKVCIIESGTCQSQLCTVVPTATPTPIPPWNIAPVTAGAAELCTSLIISDTNLAAGESMTATSKSTSNDIIAFGWWFYNMDNLTAANAPKPIRFVSAGTEVAGVIRNKQIAGSEATLTIDFADINRRDFNWTYYMPKPKRIKVDAYFKKAGTTVWSKYNAACSKTFNAATVNPTPTPVATCLCGTTNTCATSCFFDKFAAGVAYTNPVKCNLGAGLFSSAPTAANKNKWCRNYLRTKGDSNGDGKVSILDYFYYVSATVFGAKLPPTANIDFNGDGVVSSADKAVLMKSLKP